MIPDAPSPGSDDRRRVCRYAVMQSRAWLGWWGGEHFHSTPAEVLDFSLRGCRMIVEQLPPTKDQVWFYASGAGSNANSTPSDWIESKLIESRKRLFGPRVVQIAFRGSFPYEVFKAVVYGPARVGEPGSPLWAPEGTSGDDRDR